MWCQAVIDGVLALTAGDCIRETYHFRPERLVPAVFFLHGECEFLPEDGMCLAR